jgi:hypothetical protein
VSASTRVKRLSNDCIEFQGFLKGTAKMFESTYAREKPVRLAEYKVRPRAPGIREMP